jgi:hypothetical protein
MPARPLPAAPANDDLQLHTVGVEPPISQMAAAFKPTFGRLNGTVGASGATDHDALLEASELMPVGAELVFEKVHSIPAHDCKSLFAVTIGLPRTEGFDLAQNRAHFARANRGNDPPVANSHGPQRLESRNWTPALS